MDWSLAFPSQRNKKGHCFFPSCCSLYQCTAQEISHSLNQVTPQAFNTMNARRFPTTESLELLCLTLNSQQCKSSCAFPHVTGQGLKARTTPWSTVTTAVSQGICAFLLMGQSLVQKLIQWQHQVSLLLQFISMRIIEQTASPKIHSPQ